MSQVGTCKRCGEEFVQKLAQSSHWDKGVHCNKCAEIIKEEEEQDKQAIAEARDSARAAIGLPPLGVR